jgi:hypothetical protein
LRECCRAGIGQASPAIKRPSRAGFSRQILIYGAAQTVRSTQRNHTTILFRRHPMGTGLFDQRIAVSGHDRRKVAMDAER